VTKIAPHKALNLIARDKLTFDEKIALHRVLLECVLLDIREARTCEAKRHVPDMEQWSQSSGSNVIERRARPGLAGLRPHSTPWTDTSILHTGVPRS